MISIAREKHNVMCEELANGSGSNDQSKWDCSRLAATSEFPQSWGQFINGLDAGLQGSLSRGSVGVQ